MAPEENTLKEVNVDEMADLDIEQLDAIAGGAGSTSTKACPKCGYTMTRQGVPGHYVYYCTRCRKVFKA